MTSARCGTTSCQFSRRGSVTGAVTRRKLRPRVVGADVEEIAVVVEDSIRVLLARLDHLPVAVGWSAGM